MNSKEKLPFRSKITILAYVYYESSLSSILEYLLSLKEYDTTILFCISTDNIASQETIKKINTNFSNALIIKVPNIGKDIGGKLALIDLSLKLNLKSDYYIFLHDKKSPHTSLGDIWRKKLFQIVEYQNIEKIENMFKDNDTLGIIAANEFIINEYDSTTGNFNCTSNLILKKLIRHYKFKLNNYDFVGGTMFWARAEIFNDFFSKYEPLEIRATLEKGNVLDHNHGTHTHAWERILSWIAINKGYTIKGI